MATHTSYVLLTHTRISLRSFKCLLHSVAARSCVPMKLRFLTEWDAFVDSVLQHQEFALRAWCFGGLPGEAFDDLLIEGPAAMMIEAAKTNQTIAGFALRRHLGSCAAGSV